MRGAVTAFAALGCTACAIAAAPSRAQDRPPMLPTRDVDVTYRSEPGGQVIEQRSRFSATTQRMRLDLPTPGLYSVMDYRRHILSVVSTADEKVLETQGAANPAAAASDFKRGAADRVAGLPCTEWESLDSVGQPAIACFTDDGVMLRARRGPQVLAVATHVAYAPLPDALFDIPASFDRVTRPKPPPAR